MNHFEMKKLDRQMHIRCASLAISLFLFLLAWAVLCVFTLGKYLSHQFSSSPFKPFIYSTRVQSIFASWFVTYKY